MYAQVQWAGNGGRLSRVATLAVIASVVGSIVTRGETVAGPVEVPDRDRSGNLEWFFAPLCTGAGADATGEPIDLSNRLVLTVGGGEGCVQPGATVTVTMSQANLTIPMQGYQAYLQFDTSKLTFISGAYTPEPYGNWIFSPIHAVGSDIDLASFINIAGGQTPTQDDADLLTLTFTAGFTEGVAQIEFDTPPPNTEFIDMYGYAVPAATDDPLQVYIDGTAPVIACPPDLTVACFEDIPDPADDEESFEEQGGSIVEESPCEVSFAHEDVVIQPGDGCPDDPYVIERTYVATDGAGNESGPCEEPQIITVSDDTPPTIVGCSEGIEVDNNPGLCSAVVTWTPPTATDCGSPVAPEPPQHNPGDSFPVGTTTVEYRFIDRCDNEQLCSFDITVGDTEAPVITCPIDPIEVPTDADVCTASVLLDVPVTDNCNGAVITYWIEDTQITTDPYDFPLGTTTVTAKAEDESGNWATCQFDVTVSDCEAPDITCPISIEVCTDPGLCTRSVTMDATATDNCMGELTITYSIAGTPIPNPYDFPLGTWTVVAIAEDGSGNSDACEFDVKVNDCEAPDITCPSDPIEVSTDEDLCTASVVLDATATDNCTDEPTIRYWIDGTEITSPHDFGVGTTTVMAKAEDESGNESEPCYFDVTVNDGVDPEITCPTNKVADTDPDVCTASVALDATATDNCTTEPTITYWIDGTEITSPYVFEVGTTTVMAKAEDDSGNEDTCGFDVTVNDGVDPEITCPEDKTVGTEAGACSASVVLDATATDNCTGEPTIRYWIDGVEITSPYDFSVGTTTVMAKAKDESGNESEPCYFDVTVNDGVDPEITCPTDKTVGTEAGVCTASVVLDATATDNCTGEPTITYWIDDTEITSPHVFEVGTTTVMAKAEDDSGNEDTCAFGVTVNDAEAPEITYCPSIKRPNDKGVCEAEVAFAVAAEDNCSVVVTYAIESTPGSGVFDDPIESPHVFPVGTTTVQATATDPGTQTDVCTFDVMVHDTEEPVIENCPEDITQPADPGEKGAVVWWKPPSVWDNCDGALVPTGDHKPGEFFPLGTTTVTYTVQDAAGNPAEPCVFTVTVVSDSTPVVINVELAGTVASPVTRCFTFELSKCDPPSTMTFEVELELVDSMASVEFAVPLDTYDCITARDRLHTLRRTIAPLPFNGAEHRYEADFTGEKALLSGDLNGDCWIDILDFGIYHSAYTTNYGTGDTTCETLPPHADLNGDGFVGTADFTFIQAHFLRGCDPDCCGRPGSPRGDDGPIAEISVKELKKRGLGRLAAADVNGDGWLNVEDMAAFMDGAPIDNDDLQESKMIGSR